MFCFGLLSAPLRSNEADYVLLRFIYYRQPCVATQPIMFCYGLFYFLNYRQPCVAKQPIMFCYGLFYFLNYRQPCVATQPIMFYLCLFIFYLFNFFYSPFVLRNYPTDSHQIFRNCVFWCSLNNPVVLKFFGRHLEEKNAKNSENLVKISRVDSDF